jgi:hypothetical protein
MTSSTLASPARLNLGVRALKQPLTWLMVAAVVLLSLLALESATGGHAPSIVPLNNFTQSSNNGGQHEKHCADGFGFDANHNPHCRPISSG